jgi:Tfp pilus assembly protein PilX
MAASPIDSFTATGSATQGAAVPDSPLSLFRRLLGDERGIALPYALGVTMVLSALAAAIFTYTTANQGVAKRQQADQRAYGLAETGLSYALSRLQNAADPSNASNVPSTTVTLTGGTTTYSGSLSGTTWTLTSTGTVANPSGPHAGSVVRTVSMQAQITTTTQADMRPWDYLFVDQPSGCITMGNSVTMDVSLYVRGNLCLTNNSQVSSPAVHLLGNLYVENSAQIGSVGTPIDEFAATGACHYSAVVLPCGPVTHVYADAVGTTPPTITKPTVDLPYWYSHAQLGPQSACTTGAFPGGFDNDSTLNVSRGEIDLTPSTAYDCRKLDGSGNQVARLAWTPGSPGTLTIQGVIYFDAHLSWSNLNLIQYDGRAVIYGSGQVRIKNRADICGVPACDSTWDPTTDLLVFVAGSLVSQSSSDPIGGEIGNHVNFQGALYIVNDFDMDNNTTVWGPVITRSTTINNSALINAPPVPIQWMYGMPGATQTVTEVSPVQGSYAG